MSSAISKLRIISLQRKAGSFPSRLILKLLILTELKLEQKERDAQDRAKTKITAIKTRRQNKHLFRLHVSPIFIWSLQIFSLHWLMTLVIPQAHIKARLMNLLSLLYCALKGIFLLITICSSANPEMQYFCKLKPNSRSLANCKFWMD